MILARTLEQVGHVVVPLRVGNGVREAARRVLEFGRLRARRLTLILSETTDLGALDRACRELASELRALMDPGCEVRLIVRRGTLDQAVNDHIRADDADLIILPQEGVHLKSTPTVPILELLAFD